MSTRDCGRRHSIKRSHCRLRGTSQGVFANRRCTAACMDVHTACRGYPNSTASCIHIAVEKRNAPQECKNGTAFDNADKKTFVVRRVLVAQKLFGVATPPPSNPFLGGLNPQPTQSWSVTCRSGPISSHCCTMVRVLLMQNLCKPLRKKTFEIPFGPQYCTRIQHLNVWDRCLPLT